MSTARPAVPTRSSWKLSVLRSAISADRDRAGGADAGQQHDHVSGTGPTLRDRVVRILSSSDWTERGHCVVSAAGQLEEDLLERRALDRELVQHDVVRRRELADPLGRQIRDERRVLESRSPRSLARRAASAAATPPGLRTDARRRARPQLGDRRLLDELAAMDDHDAVHGLRDLGEHVARDEDRPPFGGERAKEIAQPAHAGGIEPVRGLVEHEHLGVAEQRGRETEALAHAERVALHAPASPPVNSTRASTSSTREPGSPAAGEHPEVVAAGSPRVEPRSPRAPRRPDARPVELAVRLRPSTVAPPCVRVHEPEHRCEGSWTCRRRSGRESR